MPNHRKALDSRRFRALRWGALAAYLLLIAYGSLYPFTAFQSPDAPLFSFLTLQPPKYISTSDIWVNIVVYVPLGLLLTAQLRRRAGLAGAIVLATGLGAGLSFVMETLQMFLPGRVSSVLDLAANAGGSLLGALLVWAIHPTSALGRRLARWRAEWFLPGILVEASIFILLLAMLAQLSPLLPSLHGPGAAKSIMPIWQAVLDGDLTAWRSALAYIGAVLGLGLFASFLTAPDRPVLRPFLAMLALVLAVKMVGASLLAHIPLIGWRLSFPAAVGLAGGTILLLILSRAPPLARATLAIGTLLAAFVANELTVQGDGSTPSPFNWVPFLGQMYGFSGILDILGAATPFLAVGAIANLLTPRYSRSPVMVLGAILIMALTFVLELAQENIPGRTADITDVLLAVAGWLVPWIWRPHGGTLPRRPEPGPEAVRVRRGARPWLGALLLLGVMLGIGFSANKLVELPLSEKYMPRLPRPEELPPADLPHFHLAHPRLPAPTPQDIEVLRRENPDFFSKQSNLAKRGDLAAAVLLERLVPGSQDLAELHRRLMGLRFVDRGSDQAKPLAVAYDWLYDEWTPLQRQMLQEKLAEGTDYIISLIRKDRLSPYNVYLYNAPLQGLMAMSLALYKDHPQGELAMRFTYDLWKNRTLPVWRQIMGTAGGWHEGGEYIALGIGQAVYELPAMWRAATGEDLFKTEPGLRGFLDFILYRLRPDGSHFRIGDASFAERLAPDVLPLALEFHDAAAYSIRPPESLPHPSSWPWGPLTDTALVNPDAIRQRPLSKLFDGLGLLVARSGWDKDATYVTFKAGDNFWSHSHLDQGSFTIFKGGPLALDSGFYGTQYGADHHMNYTYQTIAHNSITVTDPDDTVPARTRKGTRAIANDGGQRRIGSGWGVEPAPLDLEEWQRKREIYHTGQITQYRDDQGISLVSADVTPAYTNAYSGKGTFSHRTRRVERALRTFGYDRVDDVIVVFDRVTATKATFRKRWLLHTIERPSISGQTFAASTPPMDQPARSGGHLAGTVLLPERASIAAVGGPGFEFFVDGENYDEGGKVQQAARLHRDPDVGAWRIEVSPPTDEKDDLFLVVLLPSGNGAPAPHKVRLLREGARVGCEVAGPRRTTRWWFDPATGQASVAIAGR